MHFLFICIQLKVVKLIALQPPLFMCVCVLFLLLWRGIHWAGKGTFINQYIFSRRVKFTLFSVKSNNPSHRWSYEPLFKLQVTGPNVNALCISHTQDAVILWFKREFFILFCVFNFWKNVRMRELYAAAVVAVTQRHYPVSSQQPLIMHIKQDSGIEFGVPE